MPVEIGTELKVEGIQKGADECESEQRVCCNRGKSVKAAKVVVASIDLLEHVKFVRKLKLDKMLMKKKKKNWIT